MWGMLQDASSIAFRVSAFFSTICFSGAVDIARMQKAWGTYIDQGSGRCARFVLRWSSSSEVELSIGNPQTTKTKLLSLFLSFRLFPILPLSPFWSMISPRVHIGCCFRAHAR